MCVVCFGSYPAVTKLDGSMDSIMGLSKRVVGRLLLQAIANRGDGEEGRV